MDQSQFPLPASAATIQLFKGVLYSDAHEAQWQGLLTFQGMIRNYFSVIGLEIYLDESEGYAFLRQLPDQARENNESDLPRLIQRRPLSFQVSLLCVLLRRKLAEQEVTGGGDTRVILNRDQIVNMLRLFLPDSTNEARVIDQIDSYLQKLVDYGLVRRMKSNESLYEIRRVIRALVDAQWLGEMNEKLEAYRTHAKHTL